VHVKVEEGTCWKGGGCNARGGAKGCSGREQNGSGSKGAAHTHHPSSGIFHVWSLSPCSCSHDMRRIGLFTNLSPLQYFLKGFCMNLFPVSSVIILQHMYGVFVIEWWVRLIHRCRATLSCNNTYGFCIMGWWIDRYVMSWRAYGVNNFDKPNSNVDATSSKQFHHCLIWKVPMLHCLKSSITIYIELQLQLLCQYFDVLLTRSLVCLFDIHVWCLCRKLLGLPLTGQWPSWRLQGKMTAMKIWNYFFISKHHDPVTTSWQNWQITVLFSWLWWSLSALL
jgi:hypothetical protein